MLHGMFAYEPSGIVIVSSRNNSTQLITVKGIAIAIARPQTQ
jgi:hypothetical protein